MKKKAHSFLLEVILSLALVIIAIFPLVRIPLNSFRSEIQTMEKITCERLAENTFSEIKLLLYKNEIHWESMFKGKKQAKRHVLPNEKILLEDIAKKEVQRTFRIVVEKEKEGEEKKIYRLLLVEVELTPLSGEKKKKTYKYQYNLVAEKIPSSA